MGLTELDTYIRIRLVRHNGMWLLEGEHPQREGTIRWVPSETELKLMCDGRRRVFPLRTREEDNVVICYVDYAHDLHLRHTTRCYYSGCNCPYLCDDGHCDVADGFTYPHGMPCNLGGLEARTVASEYDFTENEEDEDDEVVQ